MRPEKTTFPPVPEELSSKNPLHYLKFYGPGAIIASVTIGSGETVFASRGGAIFGYALVWCIVLVSMLKAVQAYSSMRIITLTGRHPVYYWARMKGPKGWFPVLLGIVALFTMASTFGALSKALATLLVQLAERAPDSPAYETQLHVCASAILILSALAALGSTYRMLELGQTAIILLFLAFIVASFVALRPDLGALAWNAFVVSFPGYPDWVKEGYPAIAARPPWLEAMTFIGLIGGNSTDYTAYLSFLREKKWGLSGRLTAGEEAEDSAPPDSPEESAKGKLWLRAPLTDMLLSFSMVAMFSIIFLVLGARLLAPSRLVPHASDLLTVQARFLTELHPRLAPLYVAGIITVFLGTIYGSFELQARALWECGRVVSARLAGASLSQYRRFVVLYGSTSGLLLIWTKWDPVEIFTPAILLGVLASGVWCFATLWVDRSFLPKPYQMSLPLAGAVAIAGLVLTAFGVRSISDFLVQFR
jgi:Natural resistance-associated macrophage protein